MENLSSSEEKTELNHLELDSHDDLALLLGKMCLATNEKKKLTEQYREIGKALNDAEVGLIRAKTEQEKEDARVNVRVEKGLYKELETLIDLYKDTINCLKIQIKAEHQ
jgi:hypothetical protein